MKVRVLVFAALAVSLFGVSAEAAGRSGRRGGRGKWVNRVRKEINKEIYRNNPGPVTDAEKPLEWMRNFEEAAELAAKDGRPLMLLFTTTEMMRQSRSCNFAANRLRRAARNAKVVPVRILPPVVLSLSGLPKEEARKRRELHEKARERYGKLLREFGVSSGPTLIFTAPDKIKLNALTAPNDDKVAAAFERLAERLRAHAEATGKKPGEKQAGAKNGGEKPRKGDVEAKIEPRPEEKKAAPVDPEDDF